MDLIADLTKLDRLPDRTTVSEIYNNGNAKLTIEKGSFTPLISAYKSTHFINFYDEIGINLLNIQYSVIPLDSDFMYSSLTFMLHLEPVDAGKKMAYCVSAYGEYKDNEGNDAEIEPTDCCKSYEDLTTAIKAWTDMVDVFDDKYLNKNTIKKIISELI